MPSSSYLQINEIMQLIIKTNPKKLLDIGVGFGKYGFLSREYLELWDSEGDYCTWERKIDGIEVFKEYITPAHNFIYDEIFIGNAIDILPTLEQKYDLILLIDILEHFDYDDGLIILKECVKRGSNIIISVPYNMLQQGDIYGNIYETHRFQWKRQHFNKFTHNYILPLISGSMIIYIGEQSNNISIFWKSQKFKYVAKILDCIHLKKLMKRLLKI